MKNYMKIMREMLKRRQFIFGKQNINRHQPQIDDVVTSVYTQYNNASNISDEGASEDAVMKFVPTKKQVIDIIKSYVPDQDSVIFNISEEDVEFVDTFLYKGDSGYDHIGYMYKLTKGSVADVDGEHPESDLSGRRIMCAGPVLALDGKVPIATTREMDISDYDYFNNVFGHATPFSDVALLNRLYKGGTMEIVTDFGLPTPAMPITELPDPSYVVNITTDVLPYMINHIYMTSSNEPIIVNPDV